MSHEVPSQEPLETRAFEISAALFDEVVEAVVIRHEDRDITAEWIDLGPPVEGEESEYEAHVVIDKVPARDYARRILEWTTTDKELIEAACIEFEEKMASMWDDTLDYYSELALLDAELGLIAKSPNGPYFLKTKHELAEQGFDALDDSEVAVIARERVAMELGVWVAATEAQDEAAVEPAS